MKKIIDYLVQLDFSKIEAKLYLKLLELGPLTVQELAKKTGINRTAAYAPLRSLLDKGVIVEVMRQSRKKLVAIEPDQLKYLIERKSESVRSLQIAFPTMLQVINTSLKKTENSHISDGTYYKGRNNLKAIYEDSFKAKELRSYVKVFESSNLGKFFSDNVGIFMNALKHNQSLVMKEIFYDTPQELLDLPILAKTGRYFYKFMPDNIKLTSQDILIYDDKVAIINYENEIDAVVLNDKYYYNNSKELFDFIWQMLPEPTNS